MGLILEGNEYVEFGAFLGTLKKCEAGAWTPWELGDFGLLQSGPHFCS